MRPQLAHLSDRLIRSALRRMAKAPALPVGHKSPTGFSLRAYLGRNVSPPRDGLWRIQTPQAFRRHVLQAAFAYALAQGLDVTDEAGLVEAHGQQRVHVVPGMESNVKVTTPDDLIMCESLLDQLERDA